MKRLLLSATLGAVACAPSVQAPGHAGVCWRVITDSEQTTFRAISRGIANLETCAVQLEGAQMMEGRPVVGAYQGRFIFTDAQQITASESLDSQPFRVFELDDKLEIQAGLRRLIERRTAAADGGR